MSLQHLIIGKFLSPSTHVHNKTHMYTYQRFRQVPTFCNSTIRKFSDDVASLSRLAARDFEDVLQVDHHLFNCSTGAQKSPECSLTRKGQQAFWSTRPEIRIIPDFFQFACVCSRAHQCAPERSQVTKYFYLDMDFCLSPAVPRLSKNLPRTAGSQLNGSAFNLYIKLSYMYQSLCEAIGCRLRSTHDQTEPDAGPGTYLAGR
jgi:hypothetical protein